MISKRILKLETNLFESLSNARKLYSSKISPGVFEELVSIDPSKTFKYIEKICKFYIEFGEHNINLEGLRYQIELFDRLSSKNLIDKKDINQFKTLREFDNYISQHENLMSKSEEKALIKNAGTDVILNKKEILVLLIRDRKASIQYGSGTKWCISAKDSRNYFESYRVDNQVTFYFIFQKELDSSNPLYKIAVAVYPNLEMEVYNATDDLIDFSVVSKLGLNKNLFKPIEQNLEEKITKFVSGTWKINSKGEIDVNGDVNFKEIEMNSVFDFIGQFGKVTGDFDCSYVGLHSLKGCPNWVGGNFNCNSNYLKSLEYSPKYVEGNFDCSSNNLDSLVGSPEYVGRRYACIKNHLVSLMGISPSIGGSINCSSNMLTTLKYSPKEVNGNFSCYINDIVNLKESPEIVHGDFLCYRNQLKTLKGNLKHVDGNFNCSFNPKEFTREYVRSCFTVENGINI